MFHYCSSRRNILDLHSFDGSKTFPNFHPTFIRGNLLFYTVLKCGSSLLECSLCKHFAKFFPPLKVKVLFCK